MYLQELVQGEKWFKWHEFVGYACIYCLHLRCSLLAEKLSVFVIISLNENSIPFLQKSPSNVFFLTAFAIKLKYSVVSLF